MSQEQNSAVNSLINFVVTVIIITVCISVTESIGAALGIWLWVLWAIVYMKIFTNKLDHVNEYNAGNYHVPTNSTDTGVYMVFDGTATPDTVFGYVNFTLFSVVIVLVIGFFIFGKGWKKGLFWFWTPIFVLPLYLYLIGVIQYFPGGSTAYVNTYYQSTCTKEKCTWSGPVTIPPF